MPTDSGRRPGESIKEYWARRDRDSAADPPAGGGGGGSPPRSRAPSAGRLQPSAKDTGGKRRAASRTGRTGRAADAGGGDDGRSGRARSRARSKSRERHREIEAELAKAEERAAAAKSRRRSRSKDRAKEIEAAVSGSGGESRGRGGGGAGRTSRTRSRSRDRALQIEMEVQTADVRGGGGGGAARSRSTRARSRSQERTMEIEREIQAAEERASAAKSRRRARSRDRTGDLARAVEQDGGDGAGEGGGGEGGGGGRDKGARAFAARKARSRSRDKTAELEAAAGADDESRDKFDSSARFDSSAGPSRHGSRSRGGRPGAGTVSSLSDYSASDRSDDESAVDGNSPPNLHRDLAGARWNALHRHLQFLQRRSDLVMQAVMTTDPDDSSTPLHTAVWKAPPSLALMLIRLLPTSKELSGIFTTKDRDANTALHLCCANLEAIPPEDGALDSSVLEALIKAAPRAVSMQNTEGDSPLHMLVSAPACCSQADLGPNAAVAAERAVTALLDAPGGRDAALLQDTTGATPLHVAVAAGASERVLLRLIEYAPLATRVEDNRGMCPLHYVAAFCRTPPSAVRAMIDACPESVAAHTHNGDTPLHLCISNSASAEGAQNAAERGRLSATMAKCVELLMGGRVRDDGEVEFGGSDGGGYGQCPLLMTNREKLTPLHCCALFDAPPQLTRLLMKHPAATRAASMTNSFGATPLHLAAAQPGVAQSIATVAAIGTPEAAAVQDRLKRTPLHVAAQNIHATAQLIKALADLNPDATAEKTQRGHLPLHLAAQSQAKEPVIKALIKAFPKATEAKNKSSNTPLHDAAKYRASAGVVKLLIDTYPEAVYIQNQYGNLPLHCATAYQAPGDVVQLLLSKWPDGASMQNRNQDAPLHYAAAYATSADAVRPLIDAAPAAVLLLNSSGQSPIDRARANNAPDEIIDLLRDRASGGGGDGWGAFPPDGTFGDSGGRGGGAGFDPQF